MSDDRKLWSDPFDPLYPEWLADYRAKVLAAARTLHNACWRADEEGLFQTRLLDAGALIGRSERQVHEDVAAVRAMLVECARRLVHHAGYDRAVELADDLALGVPVEKSP